MSSWPLEVQTEELVATPQMEDQVQGGLLLHVVIRKSVVIFQLLACKNESLLLCVWGICPLNPGPCLSRDGVTGFCL